MMSDSEKSPIEGILPSPDLKTVLKIVFVLAGLAVLWWMKYSSMGGPVAREMFRIEVLIGEGHYDQAIEATSRMIKDTPTWEWAHRNRGEAYRRKGDLDRAFADFDEAIR